MEIEKQIEFKIDILDFQCLNKELVLMWLNYVRFYILVNIYRIVQILSGVNAKCLHLIF